MCAETADGKKVPDSYEEAVSRLKEIIKNLESDDQNLKTTLSLMAEGKELLRYCGEQLKDAEHQLETLQNEI